MTIAASAAPGSVQKKADKPAVTVGQFAAKISRALGFPAADDQAAVEALRNARVDLGDDLEAPLTEGQAAGILRDMGMAVTPPADVQAPINSMQADQLVTRVAMTGLQSASAAKFSPADLPTSCLNVGTRSQCDLCCVSILLPKFGLLALLAIVICDALCVSFFPPAPSASAPIH
jgi:hypothetical protein